MARSTRLHLLAGFLVSSGLAAAPPDPLDSARALHGAGRWEEALSAYRTVFDSTTDAATEAIARNNACHVLIQMARPAEALDQCRSALRLRREAGDDRGMARTLNNMGLALRLLGAYDEAAIAYREALEINERRGDAEAQVLNRSNLGVLAAAAGRYGDAMRFHATAESLAESRLAEPWARRQLVIARINLGAVLEKLGAYREALELYRELAEQASDVDAGLRAAIRVNQGVIYRNLGHPVRAIECLEEAAAIYVSLGDEAALANTKLNLALTFHLNLGRLEKADEAYREALELARRGGDRAEEIQVLFYLGNLQLEIGRPDEARSWFGLCSEQAETSGSIEGRWSGLYGLGRVAEARGRANEALDFYRSAIEQIEEVRSSLADASWRTGYFGDKRAIYASAVRVLATLAGAGDGRYEEQALDIVQQAKMRELLEYLAASRYPAAPLGTRELRRLLGRGDVVLEDFEGGDELYLWIVKHDRVRMVELGSAREVRRRVDAVRQALASDRRPPGAVTGELSRLLLGGGDALAGASRLRVAPDGPLFYLPFEILPDPGAADASLIDRLEVSYLPSASALGMLRLRRERDPPKRDAPRFVGFANPELPVGPSPRPVTPAALLVSRYGLAALPAAEKEVEAAKRAVAGEAALWLGRQATEAAFRRQAPRGARVTHLATHTVVDDRPGRGAVIVLAAGEGHDGLLRPEEILTLDYRSELTILASCRSALGGIVDGRAMSSLTGSFLAAGSSAVIATLWDVEDDASAVFMEQFYHELRRGHGAAAALRRAKMRLRADPGWNRPGLWSAFILVGETSESGLRRFLPPFDTGRFLVIVVLALAGLSFVRLAARQLRGRR